MWDCQSSHTSLLQSQKRNSTADRCKCKGTWSMLVARPKTSFFCKQGPYRDPTWVCVNWDWVPSSGLGNGEIPLLLVCKPLYPGNRPETSGSNFIQMPQPSNTQVAEDPDKNISLHIYCQIYSRYNKPACRLLVPFGRPERCHQAPQTTCEQDYQTITSQVWQLTTIKIGNTSWWWACHIKTHHHAGMTQNHQTSATRATTIMDLQGRPYYRRWSHLEGHRNSDPKQAGPSHLRTDTQRPFRTQ